MRQLNISECQNISGGDPSTLKMSAIFLTGGAATSYLSSLILPTMGTFSGIQIGLISCFLVKPATALFCGAGGGFIGYYAGPALTMATTFVVGGLASTCFAAMNA